MSNHLWSNSSTFMSKNRKAFGVLKNDYEFQRFLLRGKTKVKLEILLLCMGYNINKLHAKIQNERTGRYLFQLKETA